MSHHHRRIGARPWARKRRRVLERDGHRCVKCGRAGRLEVDHIVPLDDGGAALDAANLQTLCTFPCHAEKTRAERSGPEIEGRGEWQEFLNSQ